MTIDFHTHCFPDVLAARAIPKLSEVGRIPARLNGTVADIARSMTEADIRMSVILNIATKPSQTSSINDWAASVSNDRIHSFGTVHPDFSDWKHEIERIKSLGMKGIKFHPDYQSFFVDEPRMFPIYEKIFESGLIAVFHCGLDIGLPAPYRCTPDRMSRVLDTFQGAKIIAAHMGGLSMWDAVEHYLVGRDIYFDTSYCFGFIENAQFNRMVNNHGQKRVLFGSDSPWTNQKEEISKLRAIGLSDDAVEDILNNNAAELLKI